MKGYKDFLNESKESYNDKSFWNGVSKELAKQLKPYKVKLAKFRVDKYSRTITYEFKQRANSFILEIAHDWARDGSEGKPVTTFTVDASDEDRTFTEEVGRFAIWDELNYVAEDIINVMKSMEGEEYAQWIFESVVNEAQLAPPKGVLSVGGIEDKVVKKKFKKYTKYSGDEFDTVLKNLQDKYGKKGVFFKTLKSKESLYTYAGGYFAKYFDKPFEFILAKDGYGNAAIFAKDTAPKEFLNESCDVHSSYDEDCDDCVADKTNEKEFKPHMMYDPKTGKEYKAEKPEDHERMSKLGYTHEK